MASQSQLVAGNEPVYRASFRALTLAASATDVLTFEPPVPPTPARIVRVWRIGLSGIATAIGAAHVEVTKKSALNSGGTATAATNVPMSSDYPASGCTFRGYTANPTVGTSIGTVACGVLVFTPAATTTIAVPQLVFDFCNPMASPLILRAPTEAISVALGGVTVAGGALDAWIEWTEVNA